MSMRCSQIVFFFMFSILAISPGWAEAVRAEKIVLGLSSPVGMAFAPDGRLYVAEWGAGRVTAIDPSGLRKTLIDNISSPSGLAVDSIGRLYVASFSRNIIYRFLPMEAIGKFSPQTCPHRWAFVSTTGEDCWPPTVVPAR